MPVRFDAVKEDESLPERK